MGKKITFWGMLAAMMLSIPAQSQTILKSAAPKQTTAVTQQAFKAKTSAKARKAKNMPADAAERQYAPGTNVPFTGLRAATSSVVGHSFRDIKPKMMDEAIENAKKTADQFAQKCGSRLNKIESADQGVFSINDRDEHTPYIKSLRVVSTITYSLKD